MPEDPSDEFRAWLRTAEAGEWLLGLAPAAFAAASRLDWSGPSRPYPKALPADNAERSEILERIATDLWLLLAKLSAGSTQLFADFRLAFESGNLDDRLQRRFLRHFVYSLKEQARDPSENPAGYLYRRLRETLEKATPRVHYKTEERKRWAYYSLESSSEIAGDLQLESGATYAAWAAPFSVVTEAQLAGAFRAHDLLRLAEFFWHEATARRGRACFLPVRELRRYLSHHYASCRSPVEVSFVEQEDVGEEDRQLKRDKRALDVLAAEEFARQELKGREVPTATLESLATDVVNKWTAVRRQVFWRLYEGGSGTSLEAVAREVGLRGASSAKYHKDSSLRDIAAVLDAFDSDETGLELVDIIAALCKDRDARP